MGVGVGVGVGEGWGVFFVKSKKSVTRSKNPSFSLPLVAFLKDPELSDFAGVPVAGATSDGETGCGAARPIILRFGVAAFWPPDEGFHSASG